MQLFTLFLAVLFTSAVIADASAEKGKKHHHKISHLEEECKEIFFLEGLEFLAANTTALADKTHNNATKIAEIQAKASKDASRLASLKGNLTLVEDCAIIAAAEKFEHECKEILELEKFLAFAANSSEVASKVENNSTKITDIAAEASKGAIRLQKLESNTTLVSLCLIFDASEKEKHQCAEIKELQKFIAFADNSTALADKTNNNATKIGEIQAKASEGANRLAQLQSNATLISDCAAFENAAAGESLADTQSGVTTANTTSTGAALTSEAGDRLLGKLWLLSSIVVTVASITML